MCGGHKTHKAPAEAAERKRWVKQSEDMRADLPPSLQKTKPWTDSACLQGITTDRQRELLDLAYLTTMMSKQDSDGGLPAKASVTAGLVCDVSQAICRKPWGPPRTWCCSSQVYSFEKDRMLLPEEGLRLLGFATSGWTDGMAPSEVQDFCGMAMAVPSVTVAATSLILAAAEHRKLSDVFQNPEFQ